MVQTGVIAGMLRVGMRLRTLDFALWLLPVAWTIHSLEEWNQADWYHAHFVNGTDVTPLGMRAWLVIVIAASWIWTAIAMRIRRRGLAVGLVLGFFVIQMFGNTIQHIYWTALLGVYSHGLATALLVVVPAMVLATQRTIRDRALPVWIVALFYLTAIPIVIVTVDMADALPEGGLPMYRWGDTIARPLLSSS
jgi:hypothetical protein